MITYVVGNIFESPARVLVNTVNTKGVMGKGIAKDFKTIYPDMFKKYQELCEKGLLDIGKLWLYKTPNKWILNFPTKKHWRNPSKLEYIEAGLKKFVSTYQERGITSVAFPLLGCGNGELDWEKEVKPLMEKYLNSLAIDVYVYLYDKNSKHSEKEHNNIDDIAKWLRSEPQYLAFEEVWDDIKELLYNKSIYSNFYNSIDNFYAGLTDCQEGIYLKVEDGYIVTIYHEQLVDLWQHIRSLGFCIVTSMPGELDRIANYLLAILKELPYLKPIIISPYYKELNKQSLGLQYIPYLKDDMGMFNKNISFEVRKQC